MEGAVKLQISGVDIEIRVNQVSGSQPALLRCSFCGNDQGHVEKLVTGSGVNICNECIELCNEIIAKEENADDD